MMSNDIYNYSRNVICAAEMRTAYRANFKGGVILMKENQK